jgi:hypothetical protein
VNPQAMLLLVKSHHFLVGKISIELRKPTGQKKHGTVPCWLLQYAHGISPDLLGKSPFC